MTSALGSAVSGSGQHTERQSQETYGCAPAAARTIAAFLAGADIRINGPRPWDIQVYDDRFYHRVLREGSMGAGESFMDGWWDAGARDEFFTRVLYLDPNAKLGTLCTR
jgi:cyclopropane-fatty-acyl-phospholipid synthase